MIIDCISDLHGAKPILRGGDLLIIAGDLTFNNSINGWKLFYDWLHKQKYRQIVYIAGNHDGFLENVVSSEEVRKLPLDEEDRESSHIEYLFDNSFIFEGLKIYGMPWTPTFGEWYFMKDRGKPMKEMVDKIPEDTDILITHGPPFCTLDKTINIWGDSKYAGCKELSKRLLHLKNLKLHVFGHIHEDYGWCYKATEERDGKDVYYGHLSVNASIMNARYYPVNLPIRVSIDTKAQSPRAEILKD